MLQPTSPENEHCSVEIGKASLFLSNKIKAPKTLKLFVHSFIEQI